MLVYVVAIANLVAQVRAAQRTYKIQADIYAFSVLLHRSLPQLWIPEVKLIPPIRPSYPQRLISTLWSSATPGGCWTRVQFIRTESSQNKQNVQSTGLFPSITCMMLITFGLRYGGSGTLQNFDAICLLPLNILNEKLWVLQRTWSVNFNLISSFRYLILYIWMVLLLVGTLSTFVYWYLTCSADEKDWYASIKALSNLISGRLLHWISPGLRRRHLEYHLKVSSPLLNKTIQW